MRSITDQDGKSKTASAVNAEHYPEQHEVVSHGYPADVQPAHDQIAERAYQIWQRRGGADGSAGQDWVYAEEQLKTELGAQPNGSVQP